MLSPVSPSGQLPNLGMVVGTPETPSLQWRWGGKYAVNLHGLSVPLHQRPVSVTIPNEDTT